MDHLVRFIDTRINMWRVGICVFLLFNIGSPVWAEKTCDTMLAGETSNTMSDPFASLDFNPAIGKFDLAPAALARSLKAPTETTWLFALYDDTQHTGYMYYVVASLVPDFSVENQHPRALVVNRGGIIVKEGDRYRFLGVPNDIGELGLPERIVQGLTANGAVRLVKAFGGKAELRQTIAKYWCRLDGVAHVAPPMAKALRELGITNVCAEEKCNLPECPCR